MARARRRPGAFYRDWQTRTAAALTGGAALAALPSQYALSESLTGLSSLSLCTAAEQGGWACLAMRAGAQWNWSCGGGGLILH
jgi:hypothetical protein